MHKVIAVIDIYALLRAAAHIKQTLLNIKSQIGQNTILLDNLIIHPSQN